MPENSLPYVVSRPVQTTDDLRSLKIPDPYNDGRMPVFLECVRLLSKRFTLLTGAGGCGPFTLAAELMGAERAVTPTIEDPEFLEELLEYCLEVNLAYMKAFTKVGAEIIVVAEPTGAILSPVFFERFSGRYISRIVKEIDCPVGLHVCGDASHLIKEMCDTGAYSISLDSQVDLLETLRRAPSEVLIAGNLDPVGVFLEMDEEGVRDKTNEMLSEVREYPNYLAASGCDLSPKTPLENIEAFMEAVRSFR